MGRFINPFTDIGFKRIFGQEYSKPVLIDFLNNLLDNNPHIVDISYHDKELPAEYKKGRTIIYDIYCTIDSGEKIIVEMQNRLEANFKSRTLYYASKAVSLQGEQGKEWDYDLKAVYLIALINEVRPDFMPPKFRTDVMLTDIESKTVFTDRLRRIYLQMPLFDKKEEECENFLDCWIYILNHMETLSQMPWTAQNPAFKRLEEISELSELTREERIKYDAVIQAYRDELYIINGEKEKGRIDGRKEGLIEGRKEGRKNTLKEVVDRMMAAHQDIGLISQFTGLTPEEIQNYAN